MPDQETLNSVLVLLQTGLVALGSHSPLWVVSQPPVPEWVKKRLEPGRDLRTQRVWIFFMSSPIMPVHSRRSSSEQQFGPAQGRAL